MQERLRQRYRKKAQEDRASNSGASTPPSGRPEVGAAFGSRQNIPSPAHTSSTEFGLDDADDNGNSLFGRSATSSPAVPHRPDPDKEKSKQVFQSIFQNNFDDADQDGTDFFILFISDTGKHKRTLNYVLPGKYFNINRCAVSFIQCYFSNCRFYWRTGPGSAVEVQASVRQRWRGHERRRQPFTHAQWPIAWYLKRGGGGIWRVPGLGRHKGSPPGREEQQQWRRWRPTVRPPRSADGQAGTKEQWGKRYKHVQRSQRCIRATKIWFWI